MFHGFVDYFGSFVNHFIIFHPVYLISFLSICMNHSCSYTHTQVEIKNNEVK